MLKFRILKIGLAVTAILFLSLVFSFLNQVPKVLAQDSLLQLGFSNSETLMIVAPTQTKDEDQKKCDSPIVQRNSTAAAKNENLLSAITNELVLPLKTDTKKEDDSKMENNIGKENVPEVAPPLVGKPTIEKNISKPAVSSENKKENSTKVSSPKNIAKPITKKAETGGGIGLVGAILYETKNAGGKRVCLDSKHDRPGKSGKNKKGHIDGECCLDPDETPNSLCYYTDEKYTKLIQKYLDKKK